jgi:ATP:ADP antiporter, AAA family
LAPRSSRRLLGSAELSGKGTRKLRAVDALAQFFDVRSGEHMLVLVSFVTLLLIVSGHTMLETARDALLLSKLPRDSLALVYIAIAAVTLPTGAIASRVSIAFGAKKALLTSFFVAAVSVLVVRQLPATRNVAVGLYVLTGMIGAVLVPQFWSFAASLFSVAQGRRLLGPIASAGVLGGFVGSALAAVLLQRLTSRHLLEVAAAFFVLAGICMAKSPLGSEHEGAVVVAKKEGLGLGKNLSNTEAWREVRRDLLVGRITLLVVLSTAAVLAVDYLFKQSVAANVAPSDLGRYLARYYALLNAVALVIQLFVSSFLVRRMGVTSALLLTPTLLIAGLGLIVFSGGAHGAVLLLKGVDGALRHSIHRITIECVYLPLTNATRSRVKPIIDGALARLAQAAIACVFLALATFGHHTPRTLLAIVGTLVIVWLVIAASTRAPYLEVFRRALSRTTQVGESGSRTLSFATIEMLVERLSSPRAPDVLAAMRVLESRGRARLIPALILYHPESSVLLEALALFAKSERTDFFHLAESLLGHQDEEVRVAALRTLCIRGRIDFVRSLADNPDPCTSAYSRVWLAMHDGLVGEALDSHLTLVFTAISGATVASERARIGLLAGLTDSPRYQPFSDLILELLEHDDQDRSVSPERLQGAPIGLQLLASAVAKQGDERVIPKLIALLGSRVGRDQIRDALLALGAPAAEALVAALNDEDETSRQVRVHIPRSLSRFDLPELAEVLLVRIEHDPDGVVRYKCIRALGELSQALSLRVAPDRVLALVQHNLREYLRILSVGSVLLEDATSDRRVRATRRFLRGLLSDKKSQALDRALRLLNMRYPKENFFGLRAAVGSSDKRKRATAAEFINTLLDQPRERDGVGQLFQLVLDDEPERAVAVKASRFLAEPAPLTYQDAVVQLAGDGDSVLATIALEHARALGSRSLIDRAKTAHAKRIDSGTPHWIGHAFSVRPERLQEDLRTEPAF